MKKKESYSELSQKLDELLIQIDQEQDFEKKCSLYQESLSLITELEQKLNTEQDVITQYITD